MHLQSGNCIAEIQKWMRMNLLKLNDDKTEFILTGLHQQLDNVSDPKIHIGTDMIYPAKALWNLDFHQDSEPKNSTHINEFCSTLAPTIKTIYNVRKSLTKEAAQVLTQSLMLCQLDYCNSLLLGTANTTFINFNGFKVCPAEWYAI